MIILLCQIITIETAVIGIAKYWATFDCPVRYQRLQEFKDLSKPQNKHHRKRNKKRHLLLHSQLKEITYSLVNNS